MKRGRRIPDRPFLRLNTMSLNNLSGIVKELTGKNIARTEPEQEYDKPFNTVLQGPAAERLFQRFAGPTLAEARKKNPQRRYVACRCCGNRPRRQGSSLCAWCAWLLQ